MTDVGLVRMMEQLRSEIDELKDVEQAAEVLVDQWTGQTDYTPTVVEDWDARQALITAVKARRNDD